MQDGRKRRDRRRSVQRSAQDPARACVLGSRRGTDLRHRGGHGAPRRVSPRAPRPGPPRAAFADGFVPGIMLSGYGEMYGSDPSVSVGREVVLRTGQAAPISASYTAGAGQRAAILDYGAGRLAL